jgi:hypothetical protein
MSVCGRSPRFGVVSVSTAIDVSARSKTAWWTWLRISRRDRILLACIVGTRSVLNHIWRSAIGWQSQRRERTTCGAVATETGKHFTWNWRVRVWYELRRTKSRETRGKLVKMIYEVMVRHCWAEAVNIPVALPLLSMGFEIENAATQNLFRWPQGRSPSFKP